VPDPSPIRCAIYTRKSSEEGLNQAFNSLDAQREACEAYISSQRHEGWTAVTNHYDDGGYSGGNIERPALKRLLGDISAKLIDTVVVYKVDRLTRSLADFAKLVEQFDKQNVSFLAVSQPFNTTSSMGRLTLNVLLSFAQFERDVTGERIRDKVAASKRKGMWMGGLVPLGYEKQERSLIVNVKEAALVVEIYETFLKLGAVNELRDYLKQAGCHTKMRVGKAGAITGDKVFGDSGLRWILQNRIYRGEIEHNGVIYPGQHPAIIEKNLWDKVQLKIAENRQAPHEYLQTARPNILAGLLYDGKGNRFYTARAQKGSKCHRYYATKIKGKNARKGDNRPVRLSASKVEDLVLSQMTLLLRSSKRLMDLFVGVDTLPAEARYIVETIQDWSAAATPVRIQGILRTVLKRVIVEREQIEIQVNKQALRRTILGLEYPTENISSHIEILTIDVTAQLRSAGVTRIAIPPCGPDQKPHFSSSLIRSIATAHDWVDRILSGEILTQRAIATRTGLAERDIHRLIRLAFIAPDITECILNGGQSQQLSSATWLKGAPMDWQEQRKV
jgi:site-specific DNA recombinase